MYGVDNSIADFGGGILTWQQATYNPPSSWNTPRLMKLEVGVDSSPVEILSGEWLWDTPAANDGVIAAAREATNGRLQIWVWNGSWSLLTPDEASRGMDNLTVNEDFVIYSKSGEDRKLFSWDWPSGSGGEESLLVDMVVQSDSARMDGNLLGWSSTDGDLYYTYLGQPDISITSRDITFSDDNPIEGETLDVSVTVRNIGLLDATTDLTVRLFDGNPDSGRTQLGSDQLISGGIASEGSSVVVFDALPVGLAGDHSIYVRVDRLPDENPANNTAMEVLPVRDSDTDGPAITNVVVSEHNGDGDGIIEGGEQIKTTWSLADPSGIASTELLVDDTSITPISGLGSGNPLTANCEAVFGPLAGGNHDFSIVASDSDEDFGSVDSSAASEYLGSFQVVNTDYGDAPLPYPTLHGSEGARHVATGPRLGSNRDVEPDGQPTAAADGDDSTGTSDDEDGVTFGSTIMVGQLDASVTVNVQNAPSGARLDAWIDFNADGTWGGPFEQIADTVAVVTGGNTITFDVPSWAVNGPTYARFRLSTTGDPAPTGQADDGEVEDYLVAIEGPAVSSGLFSDQRTISDTADSARSVFAADINDDGHLDVLSASFYDDKIAWYENDGDGNFTAHTITTSTDGAVSVFAADVDGDGHMDVLSASYYGGTIAWYENDGDENFTAHTITTSTDGAVSVFAADVDGDGHTDVLSASYYGDTIVWYENDGDENFTAHTITTSTDWAVSVFAADVNRDGHMDVLSASYSADKIAWYENDGGGNFTAHTITTSTDGAYSVFAADVNGDGHMDVLSASYGDDKIAWYENDGDENFTAHTITTSTDGAVSVFAADVNGDGHMDVLSASSLDDKIAWYENDGDGSFAAHTITTSTDGAYSVFAADVDGDGHMDVLSASRNGDKIA